MDKNTIKNAYNAHGEFMPELWFITLYNTLPSKYYYNMHVEAGELDESKLQAAPILGLFKQIDGIREYNYKSIEEKYGEVYEGPINFVEPKFLDSVNSEYDSGVWIGGDNKVICLTFNKCIIFYDPQKDSLENIASLAEKIYHSYPKATKEDKTAKVGLVKISQDEYYVQFSDIKSTSVNIEENYNDDFIPVYKDIVDFLESKGSGLILIHGKIGTGKTNFIRHLCSTFPKDYVIIPNAVATRLGEPDFISFITACKDNVFILEDCEQLLVDRVDNPWNNAISTILNMADGLLSDIVNIKFICTFNADISKIDPALLRKGRCFAKYEFKELEKEKVRFLNDKYHLGIKEIKPMTLAEIYNGDSTDYTDQTKSKIGF